MTTTTNLGLTLLTSGQLQPEVTVNEDLNILDSVLGGQTAAFGNNPNTTSRLTYGYYGGNLYANGVNVAIASGTQSLTASATNYVQRTAAGAVSVNTTGFIAGLIPMANVVTNATAITTITDARPAASEGTGMATIQVGAPLGLAVATVTTGGTLAASLVCTYRISAVYPWGESAASAEVAVTTGSGTATNKNTLTWSALPTGATQAKIYGRTAGGELLIANVAAGTLTYTDTGSVTPAGVLPTGTMTLEPQQYAFKILEFQGAIGGNTTVVMPTLQQMWAVNNATTGAYTLTCKTSAGTGASIVQGTAEIVYGDGVNIVQPVSVSFTDSATLTGTTAGTIVSTMPEQGVYKKFAAYANGYENDTTTAQTISFPTTFANPPVVTTNTTGLSLTVSTTGLTINAPNNTTAYTGLIIVEGI